MRFLVESRLAQASTNDIMSLIPAEIARGQELDAQRIREALYVAADNSAAWQVVRSESRAALEELLETFPLHPYTATTVTQLAG